MVMSIEYVDTTVLKCYGTPSTNYVQKDTYLYPLRDTTFEGVSVKIPYSYKEMLAAEYGEKALTNKFFNE